MAENISSTQEYIKEILKTMFLNKWKGLKPCLQAYLGNGYITKNLRFNKLLEDTDASLHRPPI